VTYWKQLWRVELAVAACLVVYAAGLTALVRLGAAMFAPAPPGGDAIALSFFLILWFSVLPAVVLFAPAYTFLRAKGAVNFPIAVAVGLLSPVLLLFLFRAGPAAIYAIPSSVIVAIGVHAIMKRTRS
jgi:hypothetical protein